MAGSRAYTSIPSPCVSEDANTDSLSRWQTLPPCLTDALSKSPTRHIPNTPHRTSGFPSFAFVYWVVFLVLRIPLGFERGVSRMLSYVLANLLESTPRFSILSRYPSASFPHVQFQVSDSQVIVFPAPLLLLQARE